MMLTRNLARGVALAPLALLAACGSADHEAVLETVRMTEQAMHQSMTNDDIDGVIRLYDDKAVMVVSDSAPEVGKAAIRASFERMMADPTLKVELTPGPGWAADSGDLAVTTATIRYTTANEAGAPFTVEMHNQTAWRREDGVGWKIVADYNVAAPQPAAGEGA